MIFFYILGSPHPGDGQVKLDKDEYMENIVINMTISSFDWNA